MTNLCKLSITPCTHKITKRKGMRSACQDLVQINDISNPFSPLLPAPLPCWARQEFVFLRFIKRSKSHNLCFNDDTYNQCFSSKTSKPYHNMKAYQTYQRVAYRANSQIKEASRSPAKIISGISKHHISSLFQVGRLFTKRTSIQQLTHEKSLRHYLTRESLPTEDHYRYF